MDELVRRFQSDRDLSPESLFRMYESMEVSIVNWIDLNGAHLSVLRYHALELAKFAPLEVLDADEDIPIEEEENEEVEISDNTPYVPVNKVKKVEDAKVNKKKRKEGALSSVSTRNLSQNSKTDNGYQEPKKKVALKRTEETAVRRVAEPKTTKKPEKKEKQTEVAVKEEEEEKMDIDDNSDTESKEDMIETRRNTRRTPADKAVEKKFPFPLTIALSSLVNNVIYSIPLMAYLHIEAITPKRSYILKTIFPISAGRALAVGFAYFGLLKVPVFYAQTVKATMPVFTVIISRYILGERQTLRIYMSLLPIIIGVFIASITEL
ncbi:unnamed protein product [Bursaphelenchus okinawaensis]|uniref:Sugar phosphate transporter domain-containing protein n=1 Tax=Bursaphelenchus okinawaensis TaxID=465554 RepID=A0A811K4B7_9BILA|nr:unnamed protein product [Bursaphelenchus okinawaensis]CAG9090455.1 unnamed protein product [Bursaphelenchus okinawaensis]